MAVMRFFYKMSFVGYSGRSSVLKLNIKSQLPSMGDWEILNLKDSLYSDLEVGIENG